MNYSRNDLLSADATMNQLRNAVYHLARLLAKNKQSDIKGRFRQMGDNIAKTYVDYWKPVEAVHRANLRETIGTIYKEVLKSSVSVEINKSDQLIVVEDTSCALCKYDYDDVHIAGCEILMGMISTFINEINRLSGQKSYLVVEPVRVQESRALGNAKCVQVFKYKAGGEV
jgi:predicted hydrocarbon binding protein